MLADWRYTLGLLLCAALLPGCGTSSGYRGYGLSDSDRQDMLGRVDSAERRVTQARAEVDRAAAEASQLQQQLLSQKDVQSILQKRIDNLLEENHDLHQELTAVVMNAAGTPQTLQSSSLQNVSSQVQLGMEVPEETLRSLSGLADHYARRAIPKERTHASHFFGRPVCQRG